MLEVSYSSKTATYSASGTNDNARNVDGFVIEEFDRTQLCTRYTRYMTSIECMLFKNHFQKGGCFNMHDDVPCEITHMTVALLTR